MTVARQWPKVIRIQASRFRNRVELIMIGHVSIKNCVVTTSSIVATMPISKCWLINEPQNNQVPKGWCGTINTATATASGTPETDQHSHCCTGSPMQLRSFNSFGPETLELFTSLNQTLGVYFTMTSAKIKKIVKLFSTSARHPPQLAL